MAKNKPSEQNKTFDDIKAEIEVLNNNLNTLENSWNSSSMIDSSYDEEFCDEIMRSTVTISDLLKDAAKSFGADVENRVGIEKVYKKESEIKNTIEDYFYGLDKYNQWGSSLSQPIVSRGDILYVVNDYIQTAEFSYGEILKILSNDQEQQENLEGKEKETDVKLDDALSVGQEQKEIVENDVREEDKQETVEETSVTSAEKENINDEQKNKHPILEETSEVKPAIEEIKKDPSTTEIGDESPAKVEKVDLSVIRQTQEQLGIVKETVVENDVREEDKQETVEEISVTPAEKENINDEQKNKHPILEETSEVKSAVEEIKKDPSTTEIGDESPAKVEKVDLSVIRQTQVELGIISENNKPNDLKKDGLEEDNKKVTTTDMTSIFKGFKTLDEGVNFIMNTYASDYKLGDGDINAYKADMKEMLMYGLTETELKNFEETESFDVDQSIENFMNSNVLNKDNSEKGDNASVEPEMGAE